jgi:hypothetical protein
MNLYELLIYKLKVSNVVDSIELFLIDEAAYKLNWEVVTLIMQSII